MARSKRRGPPEIGQNGRQSIRRRKSQAKQRRRRSQRRSPSPPTTSTSCSTSASYRSPRTRSTRCSTCTSGYYGKSRSSGPSYSLDSYSSSSMARSRNGRSCKACECTCYNTMCSSGSYETFYSLSSTDQTNMSTRGELMLRCGTPPAYASRPGSPRLRQAWGREEARQYMQPGHNPYLAKRSCTDVICCFLLLGFIAVWSAVGYFSYLYGNPERLLFPSDSQGRLCGRQVEGRYDLRDRPYLYFFDLAQCTSAAAAIDGCPTPQVCVSECPKYYMSYIMLKENILLAAQGGAFAFGLPQPPFNTFEQGVKQMVCKENVDKSLWTSFEDVERAVRMGDCASYVIASGQVVGRCVPSVLLHLGNSTSVGREQLTNMSEALGNGTDPLAAQTAPNVQALFGDKRLVKWLFNARQYGQNILMDLNKAWPQIVTLLLTAGLIAFIWIALMRWLAGPMIWSSIIFVVGILAVGTSGSWWRWYTLDESGSGTDVRLTADLHAYLEMTDLIFWIASLLPSNAALCHILTLWAVVLSILFAIVAIFLLIMHKRIQIAVAMIIESSKALTHMMSALFFPIVPFILQMVVFIYWASVATYLQSWGEPNCQRLGVPNVNDTGNETGPGVPVDRGVLWTNGSKCDCRYLGSDLEPFCTFINVSSTNPLLTYAKLLNAFGLFWGLCFADALGQLVLAGAFASYYWAWQKPKDVPAMPVLQGFYRAVRYHLGSLAFGSLILAIVRFIRALFEYIESKVKGVDNPVADCLKKALKWVFWLLEKFLRFLSKNAYIMMAIHGGGFCKSARDAFSLLLRNMLRVFVLGKVTDFLLFLGKILITVGMGLLSYFYFEGAIKLDLDANLDAYINVELNYFYVPVIIVTLGTYCICCAFFGVYEMAVGTTFLCFLEDSERNDGSAGKPYFMSPELMKILKKDNEMDDKP